MVIRSAGSGCIYIGGNESRLAQDAVNAALATDRYRGSTRRPTLDDEVDVGDVGLVVGLEGAGVGPLVGHLHVVDVDGEVAVVAVDHRHAFVQRPLVLPREQDVGAVQPGLVGDLLVDPASVRTGSERQDWLYWFHRVDIKS